MEKLFYIHILRYQFPNRTINKICNLSKFFFINRFINNFTNSVTNCTHSRWWIEISHWVQLNWPNGDSAIGETKGCWSIAVESVSRWLVGRWRTYRWVGGRWSMVDGSVEHLLVGCCSIVSGSVEHWLVGWWLVVGGWWVGGGPIEGLVVCCWWSVTSRWLVVL